MKNPLKQLSCTKNKITGKLLSNNSLLKSLSLKNSLNISASLKPKKITQFLCTYSNIKYLS
jgi:hypothetical protein